MTGLPPQASVATTLASLGAGTALGQLTVTSAGMLLITGAVSSSTVIVWTRLLLLPHASVAVYVRFRTNLLTHVPGIVWSLCEIIGTPPQVSVAITAASLGA